MSTTTTVITHPDGTKIETTTSAGMPKTPGTLAVYYTMTGAPNPIIVDVAAAELGVDLAPVYKEVNLMGMENRSPEMLEKNPAGGLPFIELKNGTCIAETVAIAAYLEDAESTNGVSLFGTTAEEKAVVRMWSRRLEQQIAIPIMSWFRWGGAKDLFANRGHHGLLASDDAAEKQLVCAKDQLCWLDKLMAKGNNKYICGENFTICDVILFGQIWFFTNAFGSPLKPTWDELDIPCVKASYKTTSERPLVAKLAAKYAAAFAASA